MNNVRKYKKIYREDNYEANERSKFDYHQPFVVQEKLDGSCATIEFIPGQVPRLFKKEQEIDRNNPGDWKAFVDFADRTFGSGVVRDFSTIEPLSSINIWKSFSIHGEWLNSGKMPYNMTHKGTFHIFDMSINYGEIDHSPNISVLDSIVMWALDASGVLKNDEEIRFVPTIFDSVDETLSNWLQDNKMEDLYEGKKTKLKGSDSDMEGVVVKMEDGECLKFVQENLKEIVKRNKGDKNRLEIKVEGIAFENPRIDKFLQKLKDEGIINPEDNYLENKVFGTIMKNSRKLYDDLMSEEKDMMFKKFESALKKNMNKRLTNYLRGKK